eukprot:TRINITY_DN3289_c0_g1_i3.p1 TRINITY_DN3289_c0_g1~~TRINITY_DN3289_c0_g1_i3.p1  ORF type:complete len:129 (-),score=18.27 TRINITY_DN3289_c0_g1_i3:671-1057(-)
MGFFVQLGSIVRSQRRADLYNFHFICRLETNIKKLKFVTFWNSLSFISATPVVDVLFSWMVSFVALSSVALLHQYVLLDHKLPLVIGSWGAASVLLFCTPGFFYSFLAFLLERWFHVISQLLEHHVIE